MRGLRAAHGPPLPLAPAMHRRLGAKEREEGGRACGRVHHLGLRTSLTVLGLSSHIYIYILFVFLVLFIFPSCSFWGSVHVRQGAANK